MTESYYSTKEFRLEQDEWRKQNGLYTWREWVLLDPPKTPEELYDRKLRKPSLYDCVDFNRVLNPHATPKIYPENVALSAPLTESVVKRFTGLSELDTVAETSRPRYHLPDDEVQLCGLRIIRVPDRKILSDQISPYLREQGFDIEIRSFLIKDQDSYVPARVAKKMKPRGNKQEVKSSLE